MSNWMNRHQPGTLRKVSRPHYSPHRCRFAGIGKLFIIYVVYRPLVASVPFRALATRNSVGRDRRTVTATVTPDSALAEESL